MTLFKQGGKENLVQADLEFRNALLIKKTLAPAIYGLALVAEKQGKLQEQFSYLNQALGQDPNILEAQIKIGRMLLGAGQLDKAREHADKALTLDKNDPGAQILQAGVMLKSGDGAKAVALAEKVLSKYPGYPDALEFLAGERLEAGDADKAIVIVDQALRQHPDSLTFLAVKLRALDKLARVAEAEAILRRMVALQPESPLYRRGLIQFLIAHGRKDDAESELRRNADRNPQDSEAKLEVVRFVYGTRGAQAGREELDKLVRKEPGNFKLKLVMVSLMQAQNDRKSAEAMARSIVKEAGDSQEGLQAKGIIAAYVLGDGDKAGGTALVDEILAKDARNEQALFLKSSLALEENRLDQAVTDLRTILRDNPDSARSLALLGKAHEAQGALELADDHFARAFQASRMDAPFGLAYAEFLMRRGQTERAEKLLNDMIKSGHGQVSALKLLVQAKNDRGDWAGARQALDELHRLGG
jgi:predicted Zn-dependent protease